MCVKRGGEREGQSEEEYHRLATGDEMAGAGEMMTCLLVLRRGWPFRFPLRTLSYLTELQGSFLFHDAAAAAAAVVGEKLMPIPFQHTRALNGGEICWHSANINK